MRQHIVFSEARIKGDVLAFFDLRKEKSAREKILRASAVTTEVQAALDRLSANLQVWKVTISERDLA